MFLLLKILLLPIWLPIKIISELIEHSGRSHRRYASRSSTGRNNNVGGCLAALLVIVVIATIGAIAASCGGSAPPAAHKPSPRATPPASASAAPTPTATATHSATPTTHAAAPPPTSCHPLTDSGHCYEPGEFCRHSDEGTTGLAGDGEKIKCEDNNGWRWEPI